MNKKIRHIEDTVLPLTTDLNQRFGRPKDLDLTILPQINRIIWGFKKKKLIVLAGRPSMGKSALMMNMAWCFGKYRKVLFCNLETTIEEFAERLLSYTQEIDNFELTTGSCTRNKDFIEKINKFKAKTKDRNIIISADYGKTFDELIEVIEKTGNDYDVIFIDYLQKIKSTGKSEREGLDRYLNQLCDLAIEKNVCIVLGSQINRSTHEGKSVSAPSIWELKGTSGLEEKAHMIWLLHWGWWYDKELDKNDYEIRIAKNKDGRIGRYDISYIPEHYKMMEKPYDTGPEEDNGTDYFHN